MVRRPLERDIVDTFVVSFRQLTNDVGVCRRGVQMGATFVIVESTGQNVWPRSLPGLLRGPAFESWQGPFIAVLCFVSRSGLFTQIQ